jgi:hypothetical protein
MLLGYKWPHKKLPGIMVAAGFSLRQNKLEDLSKHICSAGY